jgi:hypothetical protein
MVATTEAKKLGMFVGGRARDLVSNAILILIKSNYKLILLAHFTIPKLIKKFPTYAVFVAKEEIYLQYLLQYYNKENIYNLMPGPNDIMRRKGKRQAPQGKEVAQAKSSKGTTSCCRYEP